jgi:hypothetical protein
MKLLSVLFGCVLLMFASCADTETEATPPPAPKPKLTAYQLLEKSTAELADMEQELKQLEQRQVDIAIRRQALLAEQASRLNANMVLSEALIGENGIITDSGIKFMEVLRESTSRMGKPRYRLEIDDTNRSNITIKRFPMK